MDSVAAVPWLWSTGSVAVVHGLVAPWHVGIFPGQELNLFLLYWQVDSLPLSHQGSPFFCLFDIRKELSHGQRKYLFVVLKYNKIYVEKVKA